MKKDWQVYILRCSDETFYTGVTNDMHKRLLAHNEGKTGAKYTKARRPVVLVYEETGYTRGEALSREASLRKLSRKQKIDLIEN